MALFGVTNKTNQTTIATSGSMNKVIPELLIFNVFIGLKRDYYNKLFLQILFICDFVLFNEPVKVMFISL